MMLLGLFTPADVQKSTFSDDRPQNNSLNNIMNNLHNVAIHEAGHAVADCVLGHGLTPQGIELSRFDDERFEGMVYANDSNPRDCIVATFAGPIAEYRATRACCRSNTGNNFSQISQAQTFRGGRCDIDGQGIYNAVFETRARRRRRYLGRKRRDGFRSTSSLCPGQIIRFSRRM
jgi:hypothetical protein